eukprot:4975816-Amphidinium_carterae.3
MLTRRDREEELRLCFAPALQPHLPGIVYLTVAEYEDLRRALDVIGQQIFPFQCLAFQLARTPASDLDLDTSHGLAVKAMLWNAVKHFDQYSPIARLRLMVVFPDVGEVVMIATALYDIAPTDLAHEIADHLNDYTAKVRSGSFDVRIRQQIEFNVRDEHCGGYAVPSSDTILPVQGGAKRGRSSQSGEPARDDVHMFTPPADEQDTLVSCIRWVLAADKRKCFSAEYIKIVVSNWTEQALKQQYYVADILLADLAAQYDMTGKDFVKKYWNPDHHPTRAPPVLFTVAVYCAFDLDIAVIDDNGARADGLWLRGRWLLKLERERWQVLCRPEAVDFLAVSFDITTTEPYEEAAAASTHQEPPVQGGAPKAMRLRWGSFNQGMQQRYRTSLLARKSTTLHVRRGKDLVVEYQGRISTKELLQQFARVKRVGKEYLTLKVGNPEGWTEYHFHDQGHLSRDWTGLTLYMENTRAATLSQPARGHQSARGRQADTVLPSEYEWYHSQLARQQMKRFGTQADIENAESDLLQAAEQLGLQSWQPASEARGSNEPPPRRVEPVCRALYPIVEGYDDEDDDESDDNKSLLQLAEEHKNEPDDSAVQITSVHGPIVQIRQAVFSGTITLPLSWSEQQISQHLARTFAVPMKNVGIAFARRNGVMARVHCVVEGTFPATVVHGGGKVHRVQQYSLEHTVVEKLRHDLHRFMKNTEFDTKFLEHLAHVDAKFVRCAFQSNSACQRLAALSAATDRAGMTEQTRSVREAAATAHQSSQATASAPAIPPASPREEPASAHGDGLNLDDRLKALEIWAHGLDDLGEHGSDVTTASLLTHLEKALLPVVQKAVLQQQAPIFEEAIALLLHALPQSKQGLLIEHQLVQDIVNSSFPLAIELISANSVGGRYLAFSKALRKAGYDSLGLGLAAADQCSQTLSTEDSTCTIVATIPSGQEEGSAVVTSDPYQVPAPRKRGRPPMRKPITEHQDEEQSDQVRQSVAELTAKFEQLQDKVIKVEQGWRQLPSTPSYSQETVDYDRPGGGPVSWETKIDHMDEYLAELGASNLKIVDSIKQLQEVVGLTSGRNRVPEDSHSASTLSALQSCEVKIQALQTRVFAPDDSSTAAKVQTLETKVANMAAEFTACARLSHFTWSCTQNLAVRLQVVNDTSSLAVQQLARMRAAIFPTAF